MASPGCFNVAGRYLLQWRAWIRPLVVMFCAILLIIIFPVLIFKLVQSDAPSKDKALAAALIGGLFVLITVPISLWEITQHMVHYTMPHLQKHIIRILWMVPIYAINAWFGLLMPNFSIYADTLRECYEAYVIYNFLMFLLNFLEESVDLETHFNDRPPAKPLCLCCCLPSCKMGSSLIENCKQGILQYTVIRPITSVIAFICDLTGILGENKFQANVAYPYLTVVNQISQFGAMYSLVFFYKVHKTELAPMKPLFKFLCIKAVIFFSFLQGVIIGIVVSSGVLFTTPISENKVQQLSTGLQNFLICIEMLLAALCHMFAFSHKPYVHEDVENTNWWHSFKAMWDVSDVQKDVSNHFGFIAKNVRRSSNVVASELRAQINNLRQTAHGSPEEAKNVRRSSNVVASELHAQINNLRQTAHGALEEEVIDARRSSTKSSCSNLELNVDNLNKLQVPPMVISSNETAVTTNQ